jgi:hypothetical protein
LPLWKDRYFIAPLRLRARDLPAGANTRPMLVADEASLAGMLEGAALDQPVEMELYLVALPWDLQGWEVPQRVLPLDGPALSRLVLDRRTIKVKVGKE